VLLRASCRRPAIGHWAIVGRERVNGLGSLTGRAPVSDQEWKTGPV
jgi:hypothetical protein